MERSLIFWPTKDVLLVEVCIHSNHSRDARNFETKGVFVMAYCFRCLRHNRPVKIRCFCAVSQHLLNLHAWLMFPNRWGGGAGRNSIRWTCTHVVNATQRHMGWMGFSPSVVVLRFIQMATRHGNQNRSDSDSDLPAVPIIRRNLPKRFQKEKLMKKVSPEWLAHLHLDKAWSHLKKHVPESLRSRQLWSSLKPTDGTIRVRLHVAIQPSKLVEAPWAPLQGSLKIRQENTQPKLFVPLVRSSQAKFSKNQPPTLSLTRFKFPGVIHDAGTMFFFLCMAFGVCTPPDYPVECGAKVDYQFLNKGPRALASNPLKCL